MKTVVLAGGFATRLWPITEKTAKPLVQVAGKPIISHILEKLPAELPVIVSTNQVFADDFEAWRRNEFSSRDIVVFSEDSKGEQGKKGALAAVSLVIEEFSLEEDVLVLAGDNLFLFDFEKFLAKSGDCPLLAAYELNDLEAACKFGVVVPGGDGEVAEFQEKPAQPKSSLVSTGCLFFPHRLLPELIAFSKRKNDDLGGVFEHYLNLGERVEYFDFQEKWFDIGSFPALLEAQRFLIGEGVIDNGAKISGDNRFSGSIVLGKNAVIENAVLENAVVEENAVIRESSVRNSVIGKNAVIVGVDLSGVALREESFVVNDA